MKLYRATVGACSADKLNGSSNGNVTKSKSGLDFSQIRQNKALTKLLVLAKREKIKQDFRKRNEQIVEGVWRILLERKRSNDPSILRVGSLICGLDKNDVNFEDVGLPITMNDIHVHLHHLVLSKAVYYDCNGIAGVKGARYAMIARPDIADGGEQCDPKALISLSALLDLECVNK